MRAFDKLITVHAHGRDIVFGLHADYEECCYLPWEESDGHGPVSDWETRDKYAGEVELVRDRGSKRFYDWAEANRIAKRDGWGLNDEARAALARDLGREPTKGQIRAEAVRRDFEYLRGFCNDQWQYVTVSVTMLDEDGEALSDHTESLGMVENLNDYHLTQAAEMAQALADAWTPPPGPILGFDGHGLNFRQPGEHIGARLATFSSGFKPSGEHWEAARKVLEALHAAGLLEEGVWQKCS